MASLSSFRPEKVIFTTRSLSGSTDVTVEEIRYFRRCMQKAGGTIGFSFFVFVRCSLGEVGFADAVSTRFSPPPLICRRSSSVSGIFTLSTFPPDKTSFSSRASGLNVIRSDGINTLKSFFILYNVVCFFATKKSQTLPQRAVSTKKFGFF